MFAIPEPIAVPPIGPLHGGIEGDWWAAWNFDPQVLVPAAVLAYWYIRGARGLSPKRHPRWRSALFMTGLAVVLLAMESPVDRLGEHHFSFHMIQHELFVLVGVPLMLLGAPLVPVLRGLPRGLRKPLTRVFFRSRAFRFIGRAITFPPIAVIQLVLVLYLWHFAPGWFDTALRNDAIHDAQHASFLIAAVIFWWNVIDPAPLHSRLGYGVRMLYIPPAMAARVLLSAILTFSTRPYYNAYAEATPIIPLDRLTDQQLGGLIMWVPGELLNLIAIGIIFAVWWHKSEREDTPPDTVPPIRRAQDA